MASVDSYHLIHQPLAPGKFQDSISIEDGTSVTSDPASLTNSLSGAPVFNGIGPDPLDVDDNDDATASIVINTKPSNGQSNQI